jgi:hypothetical protein
MKLKYDKYDITDKQRKTVILFAQNYPLTIIADMQDVSASTIKGRLRAFRKKYPQAFENLIAIRKAFEQDKYNIRNPKNLDESDGDKVKMKF